MTHQYNIKFELNVCNSGWDNDQKVNDHGMTEGWNELHYMLCHLMAGHKKSNKCAQLYMYDVGLSHHKVLYI